MTDIARKRSFAEIKTKQPTKQEKKTNRKPQVLTKTENQPAVKAADEYNGSPQVEQHYAFDGTLSLAMIAQHQPSRLKKLLDEVISSDQTTFIKTTFLYFFEFIGTNRKDSECLKLLFEKVLAPPSNVGIERDFTKAQQDQLKFNMDECALFNNSKPCVSRQKATKRLIKLVCSSLIDLYPAKKDYLPALLS